jgi:hypothetical protein
MTLTTHALIFTVDHPTPLCAGRLDLVQQPNGQRGTSQGLRLHNGLGVSGPSEAQVRRETGLGGKLSTRRLRAAEPDPSGLRSRGEECCARPCKRAMICAIGTGAGGIDGTKGSLRGAEFRW